MKGIISYYYLLVIFLYLSLILSLSLSLYLSISLSLSLSYFVVLKAREDLVRDVIYLFIFILFFFLTRDANAPNVYLLIY